MQTAASKEENERIKRWKTSTRAVRVTQEDLRQSFKQLSFLVGNQNIASDNSGPDKHEAAMNICSQTIWGSLMQLFHKRLERTFEEKWSILHTRNFLMVYHDIYSLP